MKSWAVVPVYSLHLALTPVPSPRQSLVCGLLSARLSCGAYAAGWLSDCAVLLPDHTGQTAELCAERPSGQSYTEGHQHRWVDWIQDKRRFLVSIEALAVSRAKGLGFQLSFSGIQASNRWVFIAAYLYGTQLCPLVLSDIGIGMGRSAIPFQLGHRILCHACGCWNDLHCTEQLSLHFSNHSTHR